MKRYLSDCFLQHFKQDRQMIFLSGARQVGKTTLAKQTFENSFKASYLNWDKISDRQLILGGSEQVANKIGLNLLSEKTPLCIFDELHKYKGWKDFLKGFFDSFEKNCKVLVTGSASFETFKKGGDSLMGRYFPYTLHPLSTAELVQKENLENLYNPVRKIDKQEWEFLYKFGGFPEPFLKAKESFYKRWSSLRLKQLLQEDVRDLTKIQEISQLEVLAKVLGSQVGQLVSYTYLAKISRVSVDTIRRWLETLKSLYYCFEVRPWYHNIARALRKEPKYYLWDWSLVEDKGARAENMVASALLKYVHYYNELGKANLGLYFIRDKQKKEVDFLITSDNKPFFLVEVKFSSKTALAKSLEYFHQQLETQFAFQVAFDLDFVGQDCFSCTKPTIVPAQTFLSQLI